MPTSQQSHATPYLVLRPSRGWIHADLRELWEWRDLLLYLAWRDLSVRYKQTLVGASWAIIQPFATMVIFSVFLGQLIGVPTAGVPYPIFNYAALLPWQLFAACLTRTSESLISNINLLSKVYFPRVVIPISSALPPIVDFWVAFVVLIGMMLFYQVTPTWNVVWLPLLLLVAWGASVGMGLWFAALNVKYRDIRYVVPFLVQFLQFASPVVYPTSLLPEGWRLVYGLNPMVAVIEGFRWALLGMEISSPPMMIVSAGIAVALLVSGLLYFRQMERTFADIA